MIAQKKVKIGVLGMGVVGTELVSLLLQNTSRIANDTGMQVSIEKIYVRTTTKTRTIDTTNLPLTTNIADIIDNPDIDVICECMGGSGCDETNIFIQRALDNGKHVIMSSKKALAKNAAILLKKAKENKKHLKYDASVGGAIPIAKVLNQVFKGDTIVKIFGIFNATSNYIYSKMETNHESFETALKSAQKIGYAENDPSEDIDGIDSLNKLVILSMFGMNLIINPNSLQSESFQNINSIDMKYANDLGFSIKPIALIKSVNNALEYKIGPCLVSNNHIVANTHNNFNSVIIEGQNIGELGFYGQGAGGKPTASAMYDDLIHVLETPIPDWDKEFVSLNENQVLNSQSKYYFRLTSNNKEIGFDDISSIFAYYGVQIENRIDTSVDGNYSDIPFFTSEISHKSLEKIQTKLCEMGIVTNSLLSMV